MDFLKLAWQYKWITFEQLRLFIKSENNRFGEITLEEFEEITHLNQIE